MSKQLKLAILLILVIIVIAIIALYLKPNSASDLSGNINENSNNNPEITVNNFEECTNAGYPVMESYPRQCQANGQTYVEIIGNELEKTDLIQVDNPRPNQIISSPILITGKARGTWFFEGSFPIVLVDENNNDLGLIIAVAQSDWMTEDFVEFKAELKFSEPKTTTGMLYFKKDNPSGLAQFEDQLLMPVKF